MSKREYKIEVGNLILKHLGLQMYAGAVPAIAELVSNAYDAMARNVWIRLPVGAALKQSDQIIVEDDGHGMTFNECKEHYLKVGRDRRAALKTDETKSYNNLSPRKVQGRKGIGKLAGFGIADQIDVQTISQNGEKCCFSLDVKQLSAGKDSLETLGDDGDKTKDKPGTVISLRRLKITRRIDENEFRQSIARRMLVLDDSFAVHINDKKVTRTEIPVQFRFPENIDTWESSTLKNGENINWWIGFCEKPIKSEEQRGVVVYVRGKLAQPPWFFDLSGGVAGQHGMQYLTGEIKAEFLDDNHDLIVTDRGGVSWEHPVAEPLKEWGQNKVKELLAKWVEMRTHKKVTSPLVTKYLKKANDLPSRERPKFEAIVKRICSIPQIDNDPSGHDFTEDLIGFIYNAMVHSEFLDILRQLNKIKGADKVSMVKTLSEYGLVDAANIVNQMKVRIKIIETLEQMIRNREPEKPNMQDYLREHPWFIDPHWSMLAHERTLDNIISGEFEKDKTKTDDGQKRLDFFCLGDRLNTAYVVEVKRPGHVVTESELNRLVKYVTFLKKEIRRISVHGLLIADSFGENDYLVESHRAAGFYEAKTWKALLHSAKTLHEDLLKNAEERTAKESDEI